jgi:predicted anti-sigma-YlaC factor YlaD
MSLPCENYRQELSSYIDGELQPDVAEQVAAHLKSCRDCQAEHESLMDVSRMFAKSVEADDIPDIWQAISDKLPSTCEVISEDLSAYIDDELAEPAKEGIDTHLANCSACAQKFSLLSKTHLLLANGLKLPEKTKVDLWPAIKSRLNEDCALIQGELSAFLDQEVAVLRHRAIVEHLLDCAGCRQTFESLFSLGDLIRSSYTPDIADDFDLWPEIKLKLQVVPFASKAKPAKTNVAAKVIQLHPRILAAVASFAVVVLLGSMLFGPHRPEVRPISAEAYLLEQALVQPADQAELMVYEGN